MADILFNIYYAILCLLVLYSLFNYKRIREEGGSLLVLALVVSFLMDSFGLIARIYVYNSTWVYNLYTIVIFPVYLLVIRDGLPKKYKPIVNYVAVGFVLLTLVNFFFLQGMKRFNDNSLLGGAALVIVFSLLYFKTRFDNPQENLLQSWRFWVVSALLIYFTGTLFYFGFLTYLNHLDKTWGVRMRTILQVMNIVFYLIFGVALLCLTRRQK